MSKFLEFLVSYITLRISYYGTASTELAVYIIGGGSGSENLSTIAEFKDNKWRKIGDLNVSKSGLSTIMQNGEFMLVGGEVSSGR